MSDFHIGYLKHHIIVEQLDSCILTFYSATTWHSTTKSLSSKISIQITYHNSILIAFTNMKLFLPIIAIACSQAAAFTSTHMIKNSPRTQLFAEYEPLEGEGKINLKIDLDSPKVATMVRNFPLDKIYKLYGLPKFIFSIHCSYFTSCLLAGRPRKGKEGFLPLLVVWHFPPV